MVFEKLMKGARLGREEMAILFGELVDGSLNDARVAAMLGVLQSRGVSVEECLGALDVLSAAALTCPGEYSEAIDVCGTGGDGKNTFNVSTTAAFIIAGAGYQVIKNGNYGMSSKVGSSHVLEALGISFPRSPHELKVRSDSAPTVFIHAPYFYPTLGRLAEIRRELGIRTIFNVLGPLLNPARPGIQLCGVSDEATLNLYAQALPARVKRYTAIMSADGYDEVSLTAPVFVKSYRGDFMFSSHDFGMVSVMPDELQIDESKDSAARTVREIVRGELGGAKEAVAIANAALAIWTYDEKLTLQEAVSQAKESIRSGAAFAALKQCEDRPEVT